MREIYVDSRRRSEPYGNSYTLFIQNPLKNVVRAELVSATVPNTIYNVTNGVNMFSITDTTNLYSVANGFYSTSTMVSAVNSGAPPTSNVQIAFLAEEGRFMFVDQTSPFSLNVYSNEFSTLTGFPLNTTLVSNIATSANGVYSSTYAGFHVIKSNSVANFKTCGEYIYLDVDELRRPHAIDAVNNVYHSQSSTIFAIIPLDVGSGCIKTFKELSDYKISVEYPKPIDQIDRLTVRWLDYNGDVVNFNGVDENGFILRFYEETPSGLVREYTTEKDKLLPKDKKLTDKQTVFVMLFLSLVFILFIKRK